MVDDGSAFNFTYGIKILDAARGHVEVFNFLLDHYNDLGVTNQQMLCFIHLMRFHYNTPESEGAHPSLATIAAKMGVDVRTVRKYIEALRDCGHIKVTERKGKTNVYNGSPLIKEALKLHLEAPRMKTSGVGRTKTSGVPRTKTSAEEDKIRSKVEEDSQADSAPAEESPEPLAFADMSTTDQRYRMAQTVASISGFAMADAEFAALDKNTKARCFKTGNLYLNSERTPPDIIRVSEWLHASEYTAANGRPTPEAIYKWITVLYDGSLKEKEQTDGLPAATGQRQSNPD